MTANVGLGKLIIKIIMKQILTSIIMSFAAMTAMAQTKADIEVSYTAMSPNFKNGEVDVKNQYVLLANAKESKFFSPISEWVDSINSTPDGASKFQEMGRAAAMKGDWDNIPRRGGSYYVVKSLAKNKMRIYDVIGAVNKLYYDETPDEWIWEITDSTKNILGYECIKASTDYHGRRWEAWFAPEIPVQNGPWKLEGLPGLILEASADGGKYTFTATGIQETTKPIIPVYRTDEYEKTDRKGFYKSKRAFIDNPLGSINSQLGGGVKVSANSGDPIFTTKDVVDFIETDYR